MNKISSGRKLLSNTRIIQALSSNACGYYCIYTILNKHRHPLCVMTDWTDNGLKNEQKLADFMKLLDSKI